MGHAPENTIASIHKALQLGASCIEIDVYLIEGHLIVFHDQRLDRTTNGTGYLWDHTFEYLRTLDAGDGEQIPTLAEVYQAVNSRAGLNIELKGPGTAEPVVESITTQTKQGGDKALFLVSSFDPQALAKVKQLDSDIQIGLLTTREIEMEKGAKLASALDAYALHSSAESVDPLGVENTHARGLKSFVYTVNCPIEIQKMSQFGVDGVFTNFPELVSKQYEGKGHIGWP